MRSVRELRGAKNHRRGRPGATADDHYGDQNARFAAQEVGGVTGRFCAVFHTSYDIYIVFYRFYDLASHAAVL